MKKLPAFGEIRFSCPHCGALAHQYWQTLYSVEMKKDARPMRYDKVKLEEVKEEQEKLSEDKRFADFEKFDELIRTTSQDLFKSIYRSNEYCYQIHNLDLATCDSCQEVTVWMQDKLIYPPSGPAGLASSDMPSVVKNLFDEAGAVFATSPKASAALLRLALQHLLIELGEKGKNINTDINNLIDKGLSSDVIKIMTVLRIVGNESVHPGEISVDDEPEIAEGLFELLNQIVDELITRPRKRAELWEKLPKTKTAIVEEKLAKRPKD